jgi:hypothetical protein
MTLIIEKPAGAKLVFAQTNNGITDPEAIIYISNVEQADGQPLEYDTAKAIHDFVAGCKTDGIWTAIKASCILAGARTLTGALVPLVGTAPTNPFVNPANESLGRLFVSGDYDRKTGLIGNGTSKYLNSNRANNADPQNSSHIAARISTQGIASVMVGGDALSNARNYIDDTGSSARFDCRTGLGVVSVASRINANTLVGVSRSSSASFDYRYNGSTLTQSTNSNAPDSVNTFIYARSNAGVIQSFSSHRIAFYSIGEHLPNQGAVTGLELLDTRVSALITAIGAAF